ncbi:unnamed protein product [Meloidogyne enterolobii]|uniref:Uncharacterized protein n=1 Tax=Meloidogyne enterolobii TaxID=390850 RepID=A0ACB0XQM8_MELEN
MAEEGLSNSDWILVEKEKNDLEKLQTNFDKLQKNLGEEKEKTVNLETELKEMDKKILQINLDHKNELEEMRQYFQKLIEENKQLKTEYDVSLRQKDEKINFLEEEIKKIASDNQNNIREMRQDFKKLIEENIKQAKDDYDACLKKKDEKINFLEEEIKMVNKNIN